MLFTLTTPCHRPSLIITFIVATGPSVWIQCQAARTKRQHQKDLQITRFRWAWRLVWECVLTLMDPGREQTQQSTRGDTHSSRMSRWGLVTCVVVLTFFLFLHFVHFCWGATNRQKGTRSPAPTHPPVLTAACCPPTCPLPCSVPYHSRREPQGWSWGIILYVAWFDNFLKPVGIPLWCFGQIYLANL